MPIKGLKQNHKEENLPALPQEQFLLGRELGLMFNQENIQSPIMKCRRYQFIFFDMQEYKEKMMERLSSGESKMIFRNISRIVLIGLTKSGRACMAAGGGNKKRFQYCTDSSGTIVYLRALQGHSGRNLIDPSLQDHVIIQSNFFQYIYHGRCAAINLHSIISSRLIPGGNRQTVFFLPGSYGQKSQGS